MKYQTKNEVQDYVFSGFIIYKIIFYQYIGKIQMRDSLIMF